MCLILLLKTPNIRVHMIMSIHIIILPCKIYIPKDQNWYRVVLIWICSQPKVDTCSSAKCWGWYPNWWLNTKILVGQVIAFCI